MHFAGMARVDSMASMASMASMNSMASMRTTYSLPESESYDMPAAGRRTRSGAKLSSLGSLGAKRTTGEEHKEEEEVEEEGAGGWRRRRERVRGAVLGACGAVVLRVLTTALRARC